MKWSGPNILLGLITPRHIKKTKENYMETIASIIKWHEETFPDATLVGQEEKFQEEFIEWNNAMGTENEIKELADMFIVACGVARFDVTCELFAIIDQNIYDSGEFQEALDNKMKLNRSRVWEKKDGLYKHVGVDNG